MSRSSTATTAMVTASRVKSASAKAPRISEATAGPPGDGHRELVGDGGVGRGAQIRDHRVDRLFVRLRVDGGHHQICGAVFGGHRADGVAAGDLGEIGAQRLDGGGVLRGQGGAVGAGDHGEHRLVAAALHGLGDRGRAGGLRALRQRVHPGGGTGTPHPAHHGEQQHHGHGEHRPGGAAAGEGRGDPAGDGGRCCGGVPGPMSAGGGRGCSHCGSFERRPLVAAEVRSRGRVLSTLWRAPSERINLLMEPRLHPAASVTLAP